MISSRLASKVELDTVLGTQDLYELLEVIAVDHANRALAERVAAERQRRSR